MEHLIAVRSNVPVGLDPLVRIPRCPRATCLHLGVFAIDSVTPVYCPLCDDMIPAVEL
jgi:hypothetical protein